MQTNKGWNQNLMMSLYAKEASFDAGVTMNGTNACSMSGYEFEPSWPDKVESDKGEVTGKEFGYDQEITQYGFESTYKEPKAKPNSLAGLAALVLGSISSTQDGELTAYKHVIVPVTVGTALPSIQVEHKKGGLQYAYTGVKGNSLKISGEAGGIVSLEAALLGSGSRSTTSTEFAAALTESWLLLSKMSLWAETGANISIEAAASRTQGAENISSDTPDDLGPRLQKFDFGWNNNLAAQLGCGGDGVAQDIDYGRRSADMKFSVLQSGSTELDYYLNQNVIALELNLKGALIADGGAMYYGFDLIIPRCKIKAPPLPGGGIDDSLAQEFDVEIFDDGTNSPAEIIVYNTKSAYLA